MNKVIKIKTPKNFSFDACLQFLDRGYAECLYSINDKSVTRLIRISNGLVVIEVSAHSKGIHINVNTLYRLGSGMRGNDGCGKGSKLSKIETHEIKSYVMDWFDLERDISGFYQLLASRKQTKDFPKNYYGLRLMGIVDLFEALCWCVIGQQINLTFAHKIKTRLVHKYGDKIVEAENTHYCFPRPQTLLNANRDELVAMQFSKQKINYIYNISQAFCSDELSKSALLKLSKTEQMEKLLAIKGIGPWTANYVSMKSLRDMTCIAYGDTGLSLSLHRVFATERKPDKDTIDKVFKSFGGWESYLNFYLWKSLS